MAGARECESGCAKGARVCERRARECERRVCECGESRSFDPLSFCFPTLPHTPGRKRNQIRLQSGLSVLACLQEDRVERG